MTAKSFASVEALIESIKNDNEWPEDYINQLNEFYDEEENPQQKCEEFEPNGNYDEQYDNTINEWQKPDADLYYEQSVPFKDIDSFMSETCLKLGKKPPANIESIDTAQQLYVKFREHLMYSVGIKRPTNIQAPMWPSILRGLSVACISGPSSGKTTGYLIPIINTVGKMYVEKTEKNNLPGPGYIIICSSSRKVLKTCELAKKLNFSASTKICSLENSNFTKEETNSIYAGCDILIATPVSFTKALEIQLINYSSCTLLILDDVDKSLLLHMNHLKQIMLDYIKLAKSRLMNGISIKNALVTQVIVCAEKYTENVRKLIQSLHDPITIIGNYLESVLVEGIQCEVEFFENESTRDLEFIDTFLNSQKQFKHIVICCKNSVECEKVDELLKQFKGNVILVQEDTPHFTYQAIYSRWQTIPAKFTALIISDTCIDMIPQINDASCVIHYSIPDESKETFGARFRLMAKKLVDSKTPRKTSLLMSSANKRQAKEIVSFLKRLNKMHLNGSDLTIPKGLIALEDQDKRGLCNTYATLGKCPYKDVFCFKEHNVTKYTSNGLPNQGQLKFLITHVSTANEYYIRIISHITKSCNSGNWISFEPSYETFNAVLQKLSTSTLGQVKKEQIIVNKMFALHVAKNDDVIIHRVRVREVLGDQELKHYQKKCLFYLKVYHVDFGYITQVNLEDLIEIPDELEKIPDLAFKAYLVGVQPKDNETEWSHKATSFVYNTIRDQNVAFVTGWIYLESGGVFWLGDVKVFHWLKCVKLETVSASLAQDLVANDYAIRSPLILPFMDPSQKESILLKWKIDIQKRKSQYAYLDKENTMNEVYLAHFNNHEIYIHLSKFSSLLINLEKKISTTELLPLKTFEKGLICLAKCELDNSVNRAIIKSINKKGTVDVFYLDHGELFEVDKEMCYEIDINTISILPFQAVKCTLYGFTGSLDEDLMYQVSRNEDDLFKKLLAKVMTYDSEKSEIILYTQTNEDATNYEYTSISKLLVDKGFGHLSETLPCVHSVQLKKRVAINNDEGEDEDDIPEYQKDVSDRFLEKIEQHMESWMKALKIISPESSPKPTNQKSSSSNKIVISEVDEIEPELPEGPSPYKPIPVDYEEGDFDYENVDRDFIAPYDKKDDEGRDSAEESDEELQKAEDV